MQFDLDDLPSEPTLLQHLIRDMAAAVEHRDGEIERLDPDQLALTLEEIDSDLAREEEASAWREANDRTVLPSQAVARPFAARGRPPRQ